MMEDYGVITISYKNGNLSHIPVYQYYTIQGCMLVVGCEDNSISHINLDQIEYFTYIPKEQQ